jgi:hypothetical protein
MSNLKIETLPVGAILRGMTSGSEMFETGPTPYYYVYLGAVHREVVSIDELLDPKCWLQHAYHETIGVCLDREQVRNGPPFIVSFRLYENLRRIA